MNKSKLIRPSGLWTSNVIDRVVCFRDWQFHILRSQFTSQIWLVLQENQPVWGWNLYTNTTVEQQIFARRKFFVLDVKFVRFMKISCMQDIFLKTSFRRLYLRNYWVDFDKLDLVGKLLKSGRDCHGRTSVTIDIIMYSCMSADYSMIS